MATSPKADRELAKIQAADADAEAMNDTVVTGEVVSKDGKTYDYVEFKDGKFRVRERIGSMASLKWSAVIESGMNTDDSKAGAAIYAMLQSVILKEDWPSFENSALETDAELDELLDVIVKALEVVAGRPTQQS